MLVSTDKEKERRRRVRKERKRDDMIFWQTGETRGIFSFPLILRIYLEDFDQNLPKSRPGPTTILPLSLIERETWLIDQQKNMSLHGVGFMHCYPFSSQLVLNLTLALSWVLMGHLLKLCNKGHIGVLHLTVLELSFGGRNRK